MSNQSWTKVLGTVLQYSYFSVISRFPLKTVHPFRNFLEVLPPPTLYKVETRKNSRVQHCLRGEGRGWTYVNWKTLQKRKSVPRLLSMIVGLKKTHKKNVGLIVIVGLGGGGRGGRWEETKFMAQNVALTRK